MNITNVTLNLKLKTIPLFRMQTILHSSVFSKLNFRSWSAALATAIGVSLNNYRLCGSIYTTIGIGNSKSIEPAISKVALSDTNGFCNKDVISSGPASNIRHTCRTSSQIEGTPAQTGTIILG